MFMVILLWYSCVYMQRREQEVEEDSLEHLGF